MGWWGAESLQQAHRGEEGHSAGKGAQGRDSGQNQAEKWAPLIQGQRRQQQVQADPAAAGQRGPWQQECRGSQGIQEEPEEKGWLPVSELGPVLEGAVPPGF